MTEVLDVAGVRALLGELVPELRAKRTRLKPVVVQLRAEKKVWAPKGVTPEHRYLESLTHTPWGSKVATTFAQEMSVCGYLSPTSVPGDNDPAWALWSKARMPLIEDILIREAFQYGESFAVALTAKDRPSSAVAKPLPPYHTAAIYDDPVVDVWPRAVLTTVADRKTARPVKGTLYANDWVYPLSFPEGLDVSTAVIDGNAWQHKSEVTPVVRFLNEIDSQGITTGKVEPLLPLLERIRKDTYDRVLIQHKSSWKVRTISGLEAPENATEQDLQQEKMRLAVEDILVSSDPQAKFGTLDESPLEDLIKAKESDVYEVCAIAPIPPSAVMPGNISNVSAEAIAELRNGFENRVADHKEVLGEGFGWFIQALAVQAGIVIDPESQATIQWDDRSVRSLAQAADAWSKAVDSLEIPPQMIWSKLPGVTQGEVDRWINYANRSQGQQTLADIFNRAPSQTVEPAAVEPEA